MEVTNLVAQFFQIVTKIFQNYILNIAQQFIDNVGVKDSKTIYNNKKIAFEISCHIL